MKVPRAIALPIVLTICALALLTASVCFFLSASESHQLEHLGNGEPNLNFPGMTNPPPTAAELAATREGYKTLPSVTEFYFRWFGIGFLLPVATLITGYFLIGPSECNASALTWYVCLSLLTMALWSVSSYIAVHVGFVRFTHYL